MEDTALPKKPTSAKTTLKKAVAWAKAHASEVMSHIADGSFNMVRGVDRIPGDYQLGDTSTFKRVSLNTKNYYMKFISTSKYWKKYPSRESAYVGASTDRIAGGYGDTFVVIPADDASVGVCPSHDLWKSFPVLEKTFDITSLNSLNDIITSLMKKIDGEIIPDTDDNLRQVMRGWTLKKLHDAGSSGLSRRNYEMIAVTNAVSVMVEQNLANFEQLLDYCLNPDSNGFKAMTAKKANIPEKPGVEVWVEGSVLFVRQSQFEEFMEEYLK